MVRYITLVLLFFIIACKDTPNRTENSPASDSESNEVKLPIYPAALDSVFLAHGGMDHWRKQRTLSYQLVKEAGNEIHTIDLMTRKDVIEFKDFSLGYDGKDVWLADPEGLYEGDAVFYHNLMFYFFAMPFVLGDPGINYDEAKPLQFEGKEYPGIRISYNSGIGTSPKDEYFIHYDRSSYQMKWLGYTVTYRTKEKSDNIKWIRYEDWNTTDGLLLPSKLSWYAYEGRQIKERKSSRVFAKVQLSEMPKPVSFYEKPENGLTVASSSDQ